MYSLSVHWEPTFWKWPEMNLKAKMYALPCFCSQVAFAYNTLQKAGLYKKAVELFEKVLRIDPKNIYAANGIAIAMAESGHVEKARDFFIQVSFDDLFSSLAYNLCC
jgi:tetratricopeptide (TPR) repeat protein